MSAPDLDAALNAINAVPLNRDKVANGRKIIAIAGPPASGKSTFAETLCERIENACVVPMDGYHLDNSVIEPRGLLARKGAPETFDVDGFIHTIQACRTTADVHYPTFDRQKDRAVPNSGHVTARDQTILVEGNYLLLDTPPWNALAREWDFSILLDVAVATLRQRLIDRWLAHGHDLEAATLRAEGNDLSNAKTVLTQSRAADLTIQQA